MTRRGKVAILGPDLTLDQKKLVAGSIAACVVLVVMGWAASQLFPTAVPAMPGVGKVAVLVPRSFVRDTAKSDAAVVAQVGRSDSLQLLELPKDRAAAWLRVQASPGGKPAKPGYIPMADVASWTNWSLDATDAVKMALLMRPEDGASDDQLKAYGNRLGGLQTQVSGKPEEEQVKTEIARIDKLVADRKPAEVQPSADVTPEAEPAPVVPNEPSLTPAQLVARGQYALTKQYNVSRARYYANEALKRDKNNAGAIALLKDIREFNESFGSKTQ